MHGQLGDANVHGAHAGVGRQDGPDGGAAAHVATHHELLHGDPVLVTDLLEGQRGGHRGGVPLRAGEAQP